MQSESKSTQTTSRPLIDGFIEAWHINLQKLREQNMEDAEIKDIIEKFLDDYVKTLNESQCNDIFREFGFKKLIEFMYTVRKDVEEDLLDFSPKKQLWAWFALCKCSGDAAATV
jgi:hypothetical protein